MLNQTISRVRRNHGLEHATIHVLADKYKHFSAQGNSDHLGFSLNIYGDISEEEIEGAVLEAYSRMKNGEKELAVHPNCGTALLTTATLVTIATQAVFGFENLRQGKDRNKLSVIFNSGPTAVLMAVIAIIVSRPLGLYLQAHYTTDGDLGNLEIIGVDRVSPSIITRLFHYLLAGGRKKYHPKAYRIVTQG